MSELTPDSLADFRFLSQLEISLDGAKVAFLVKEANEEEDGYDSNIWLYDFSDRSSYQLTTSNQDESFAWTGEDELLFTSSRNRESEEEVTDFYRINVNGGEAVKAFTVPQPVSGFEWTGEKLIYKSPVKITNDEEEDNGEEPRCLTLDEIPFWSNGKGFTNKKRIHLFSFSEDMEEPIELTEGSVSVEEYAVRDGKAVFVGRDYRDKAPITNSLYLVDLDTEDSSPVRLTEEEFQFRLVEFSGPESLYVTMTDMEEAGLNQNHRLYEYDLRSEELTLLTPDWDSSFANSVLTDVRLGQGQDSTIDGERFYFVSTRKGFSCLSSISPSGEVEHLTGRKGSVDDFSVRDGRAVYVKLSDDHLQELYTLSDKGEERKLTSLNDKAFSEAVFTSPEGFTVERGEVEIDSWIIRPHDFDAEKQYPAILEVHGGPKAVYGDVYFHEMQLLANQGYVVIYSNPRGSDGKGNDFADIRGKYGGEDYKDIMRVVDVALKKYSFIDRENLGVTGGSYGGFMTNWIIGHTDRFSAAVSSRSISNWVSKFNTTDIGYFFVADQQNGNPWENHDRLWEQSPLKYADKVETPTLFIHSREDYRCWEGEAMQMFTALKYHGVPARLCLFEGENHNLSRNGTPKNRFKRLEEMLAWFDKYLK
ncbi:S9 family peptidase [Candidatus Bipolaricaulota bacterium]|nr:S9 family peptidase [Candidatus Bipolaricaulota bacterium]